MNELQQRNQVLALEEAIRETPEQVDLEALTSHYFAEGIYLRELRIPAGVVVVGKIHRTQHLTIICSGTVKITTDHGTREITGPAVFVSEPGAKKAAYAVTDVVVMNPHPAETKDLQALEKHFIAPSFEALEQEKTHVLG